MTFNEYQVAALTTAEFPLCLVDSMTESGIVVQRPAKFVYPVMGLVGEAGEVAEKFKKIIRDKHGKLEAEDVELIKKELGDVLWYVAVIADTIGLKLDDVAAANNEKLASRKERNVIKGSGDER